MYPLDMANAKSTIMKTVGKISSDGRPDRHSRAPTNIGGDDGRSRWRDVAEKEERLDEDKSVARSSASVTIELDRRQGG
jgi:hypothetical protein